MSWSGLPFEEDPNLDRTIGGASLINERAEKAEARVRELEEALRLSIEVIDDAWNQFSYEVNGVKKTGGLSTLEWIEETLPKLRAVLGSGGPTGDK